MPIHQVMRLSRGAINRTGNATEADGSKILANILPAPAGVVLVESQRIGGSNSADCPSDLPGRPIGLCPLPIVRFLPTAAPSDLNVTRSSSRCPFNQKSLLLRNF